MGRSQRHLFQEHGYTSDGTWIGDYIGWAVPDPTIAGLSPPSAVAGTVDIALTITGTGFLPGATITFNGVGDDALVVSPTEIQSLVGDAGLPAGLYPVTVIVDGKASEPFDFEYTAAGLMATKSKKGK